MALWVEVAELAEQLAGEGSRLKKRAAIAAALGRVAAESVEDAGLFAMYLSGEAFAECDGRKLNAGGALLSRAVLQISGAADGALTAAYRLHGDLGASAAHIWPAQSGGTLTLNDLREALAAMAVARTTAIRSALLEGLLQRSNALEAKYLLKLMLADMRIGVKQALIEEAIAAAATSAGAPADAPAVRHAVMLEADLGHAVQRAFAGTLGEARMMLFHPMGFMLASPVDTPEEAVERFTAPVPKPVKPKKPAKRKSAAVDSAVESAEATHEPDEAWHIVQQSEGRTAATEQMTNAIPVNDDAALEREADIMGTAALSSTAGVLAFLEDKYDGMRAQVHCGDAEAPGRVAIYSRNREDITASFPELAEAFAGVREPLILDGEILGWDFASARALPFAIMGQRIGRKVVTDAMRRQIPVVFMGFDLLFADGELLLPLPLTERRARLESVFARWSEVARAGFVKAEAQGSLFAASGHLAGADPTLSQGARKDGPPGLGGVSTNPLRWLLSSTQRVADAAAIDAAYRDARKRKNEGVMLKAAGSAYLPGRRGLAWVKLKRELGTLDVVITGAEYGSGKRAQLLSDYTFAVRSAEGELLNVGKAYSGVTDAEILTLTEWLKAHTLEDHGHFRTVEPQIILEVAFNNVMRSDRHASSFALRFPRIVRIRDDKPLAEIDTVERVEEIYQSQPDRPDEES